MSTPDFVKLHRKENDEDSDSWLLPYSDMMTLLMCFFVILLSMSSLDMSKVERMAQQFSRKDTMTLKQLEEKIKEFVKQENLTEQINVELTPRGVEISFK